MKVRLFIFCFLLVSFAQAQQVPGIRFEEKLTWKQVQEKAKKENRYIFMDVFTTWCGPCKKMDRDVFSQQKVGELFNANFINIKVQADVTNKDSDEVKKWYEDAQAIVKTYNIDSYPVYLFFSPDGELVHRINGASPTAADFISKTEHALSGYPKQRWQFQTGKEEPGFLLSLIKSAQLMNDREFLPVVTNRYLLTQKDLLTDENLNFIALATTKTTDPGFLILRKHPAKANAVLGPGRSEAIVKTVVFDELVLPYLRINGVKKDYGGGMVSYTGKVADEVNWSEVKSTLDGTFPDLSEELIMMARPMYYQWTKDWTAYTQYVSSIKGKLDNQQLNSYANNIFIFSEDIKVLEQALDWSKELAIQREKSNPQYLYTYANLLYKVGKKEEAIKVMNEAAVLAGAEGEFLKEIIEKMKSDKRTW